jgi:hypothetical protein
VIQLIKIIMKKLHLRLFTLLLTTLAFALIAANFTTPQTSANPNNTTIIYQQTTPTPLSAQDLSEIGSTEGILIMGIIIVFIATIPILLRKK